MISKLLFDCGLILVRPWRKSVTISPSLRYLPHLSSRSFWGRFTRVFSPSQRMHWPRGLSEPRVIDWNKRNGAGALTRQICSLKRYGLRTFGPKRGFRRGPGLALIQARWFIQCGQSIQLEVSGYDLALTTLWCTAQWHALTVSSHYRPTLVWSPISIITGMDLREVFTVRLNVPFKRR